MASQYEQILSSFEAKLKTLIAEYQSLKSENATLQAELEKSRNDLKSAHRDFLNLQDDYNQFRIAASLTGASEAEKEESKKSIQKLVREIDRCLALLND